MNRLRISRDVFLTKIKQLFEVPIADVPTLSRQSPEFKNMVYITFLLSLQDLREQEMYKSNNEANKWYIALLEHVVNNDITKLTVEEKKEIANFLNAKLKVKLFIVDDMIDEIKNIKRPDKQEKLMKYIDDTFSFPKQIEDVYIKKKLLGLEDKTIDEFLDSLQLEPIIEKINSLKKGKKVTKTEIRIFEPFSKINYVAYASEMERFLMNKIPRYAQYMAMKIIEQN